MSGYVAVIGGSHVALSGSSFGKLCSEGNYGVVSLKLGGEARNLSERLAMLGSDVKLITALGKDDFAAKIKAACDAYGVDYSASLTIDAPTSVAAELSDESGENVYRVFDYRVLRNLDIQFLSQRLSLLNGSSACFVDVEFDGDKLEYLLKNVTSPIFIDTVSVRSSSKLRPLLPYIHTVKANKAELENLVGFSLENENNILAATEILLHGGVKNVFVTCGKQGIWYNDGTHFGHADAGAAVIVNRSGAGVAVEAALIKSFISGLSVDEAAAEGVKAALEYLSAAHI